MLADCPAEPPTATCLKHDDDVVVKCTNRLSGVAPEPGTIRIVGPTGTPAQSGIGRLQFYENGLFLLVEELLFCENNLKYLPQVSAVFVQTAGLCSLSRLLVVRWGTAMSR